MRTISFFRNHWAQLEIAYYLDGQLVHTTVIFTSDRLRIKAIDAWIMDGQIFDNQ